MSLPSVPPEEPSAERSGVAERLLEQPLRNFGVGVTAVILGVTAAFGGLEEADGSDRATAIKVGTTMTADPLDITIKRLVWADELPGVPTMENVSCRPAIVENTSDKSLAPLYTQEAVTVNGVDGLVSGPEFDLTTADDDDRTDRHGADQLLHHADSSTLNPLQPGLTYEAAFLYEQRGSARAADEVTVQLVRHTLRVNSLDQTEMWLDPAVIAESALTVQPAKVAGNDSAGTTDPPTDTETETLTDAGTDTTNAGSFTVTDTRAAG
ncbi:hypothetical protein GCM10022223_46700 [Kineosporia mesophila]|uniref:Alternate signal-mediated exported protein n=1 Tax=Kineosporia mesophila TaxID=566012 RepID=A0ABP7A3M1_9ACTN|nr:hypothetical protein [Kineosporia mesophila]MCD5353781.1 hypothetical protein [Kineosporia mesophila]